jgi:hypothetical protein
MAKKVAFKLPAALVTLMGKIQSTFDGNPDFYQLVDIKDLNFDIDVAGIKDKVKSTNGNYWMIGATIDKRWFTWKFVDITKENEADALLKKMPDNMFGGLMVATSSYKSVFEGTLAFRLRPNPKTFKTTKAAIDRWLAMPVNESFKGLLSMKAEAVAA